MRVVAKLVAGIICSAATVVWLSAQQAAPATLFEGARLIVGDGSAPIENSAFLVQGNTITWAGKRGERQPPAGAQRVDLAGKTVMPSLIDGHNHTGLVNERRLELKANHTRDNLIDQMQRYAYYGVAAHAQHGPRVDQNRRTSCATR